MTATATTMTIGTATTTMLKLQDDPVITLSCSMGTYSIAKRMPVALTR